MRILSFSIWGHLSSNQTPYKMSILPRVTTSEGQVYDRIKMKIVPVHIHQYFDFHRDNLFLSASPPPIMFSNCYILSSMWLTLADNSRCPLARLSKIFCMDSYLSMSERLEIITFFFSSFTFDESCASRSFNRL